MTSKKFVPLEIEQLIERINQSEQDFKDGNFKTSEQLLKRFSKFELNWFLLFLCNQIAFLIKI